MADCLQYEMARYVFQMSVENSNGLIISRVIRIYCSYDYLGQAVFRLNCTPPASDYRSNNCQIILSGSIEGFDFQFSIDQMDHLISTITTTVTVATTAAEGATIATPLVVVLLVLVAGFATKAFVV